MMVCIKKISIPIIVLFFSQTVLLASEKCNFKSGNYAKELSNPKNIKKIEIVTPNSAKYSKNIFKIITSSKLGNIPDNLKERIKANLRINYSFGYCDFKANIRQHGDWLDHITYNDKKEFIRSLDVKLKDGNILNNVRFKLLLPGTRNNYHEILGTILLKELGFIAPDTFQVQTKVNGVNSLMLFQENSNKELLEKNKRREGPIFEGDETYLWSYKNYPNFKLENISLSKMINEKWILKGKNSKKITLNAYSKLQKAYLEYSHNINDKHRTIIIPDNENGKKFDEYFLTLTAFNGTHALRPHNRKYYFNSFEDTFEPIYYDGMLQLDLPFSQSNEKIISSIKNLGSIKDYTPLVNNLNNLNDILIKFKNSIKDSENITNEKGKNLVEIFFYNSIENIKSNEKKIKKMFDDAKKKDVKLFSNIDTFEKYLNNINKHQVNQVTLISLNEDENNILGKTNDEKTYKFSVNDLSKIISRKSFQEKSFVLIQKDHQIEKKTDKIKILNHEKIGKIKFSEGINLEINNKNNIINISQKNKNDWISFNDSQLDDWEINFFGSTKKQKNILVSSERINEYGLTGCLNFYNSNFNNTSINIDTSYCEDGLNIIKSKGNLANINVKNSNSDAIDLDFSEIKINSLFVSNAKNDCLDVSGGVYIIQNFESTFCGDKGISVGEKSTVNIKSFQIKNSNIGISSKDLSNTIIKNTNIENVEICFEVKQKKQEFGGAKLIIENEEFNCKEKSIVDKNSELII